MQQVLRDRDVDQRRVDIPMAKIGREERQAILRDVPDRLPVSRRQWSLLKSFARQLSS